MYLPGYTDIWKTWQRKAGPRRRRRPSGRREEVRIEEERRRERRRRAAGGQPRRLRGLHLQPGPVPPDRERLAVLRFTGGGRVGAPAALPTSVDLRATWWSINNQEDTGSCVGWATGRRGGEVPHGPGRPIAQNALLSPRHVWMASKETDTYHGPTRELHGGCRHHAQGGARRRSKARRGAHGRPPVPHPDQDVHRQRERVLRELRAAASISAYFNLRRT